MPDISLIILSHNKPGFVKEAVQCALDQTHANWEAALVDSGVLLSQGFFGYLNDPRIKVIQSGESPELARTKNMASWCFNRWLNSGQVSGELIVYLCDDDLLYPEAFETWWKFYIEHDRKPQAMYSSQDIGLIDKDGTNKIIGKRTANRPAGKFCKGRRLDCRVDYLQFCHTAAILKEFSRVYRTTEYHLEDKRYARHADGIFMEQIGKLTTVYPINKVLSMNRRTADSVNITYATSATGRFFMTLREKVKGTWERLVARPY